MPARTHGLTESAEYETWQRMKVRCGNPRAVNYNRYGAVGVRVCDEWAHDFMAFYRHVGPRPSPEYSIDRIDNARGYEPGNVRWATRLQQSRNKRTNIVLSLNGETHTMQEWAERLGLHYGTLHARHRRNPDPAFVLTPGDRRATLTPNDWDAIRASTERPNVLARQYGVNPTTIVRIQNGQRSHWTS